MVRITKENKYKFGDAFKFSVIVGIIFLIGIIFLVNNALALSVGCDSGQRMISDPTSEFGFRCVEMGFIGETQLTFSILFDILMEEPAIALGAILFLGIIGIVIVVLIVRRIRNG